MLYPLYDLPGTAWGIDTIAFRKSPEYTTRILMNRDGYGDYWDKAKANTEAAYKNNLLSAKQWELWMKMYNNRDKELGNAYPLSPEMQKAIDGEKKDGAAATNQAIEFKLPMGSVWAAIWDTLKPK
ncbi:MAG: hypothetical protein HZC40_02790 [Chloroflexi bacterium]|nr:hypothetical protein [Chloroflexota bacterium]